MTRWSRYPLWSAVLALAMLLAVGGRYAWTHLDGTGRAGLIGGMLPPAAVVLGALIALSGVVRTVTENREARMQSHQREVRRALHDRYAVAAGQLASESPLVRQAGALTLSGLADDWYAHADPQQRTVCVELLCAYLRTKGKRGDPARDLIVDQIRWHTKVGIDPARNWGQLPGGMDLRGADLRGMSLCGPGSRLTHVDLRGASLDEAELTDVMLDRVRLDGCSLKGVTLDRATCDGVTARGADLRDASLRNVTVLGGTSVDGANIARADVTGADLKMLQGLDTALGADALTWDGATRWPGDGPAEWFTRSRAGVTAPLAAD
jgi:hypothetical protein